MARVALAQATKPEEKKVYFQSEFGLTKVCGDSFVDKEICLIPLGLNQGVYTTVYHKVSAKVRGKVGFRGLYDTNIICKSVDPETLEPTGEPCMCCKLAEEQAEKFDKDNKDKRLISWASRIIHIPVMVLKVGEQKTYGGKAPVELLDLNSPLFSYLELSEYTFKNKFCTALKKQLENDGKITYETSEEEAETLVNKWLGASIIKIRYVQGKTKYPEKDYSFIPFYSKAIGIKTGSYEGIVHYKKNTELMNEVNKYLTLFDENQTKLFTSYTDEELKNYVVDSVERAENIETAIKADEAQKAKALPPKQEQVVEMVEEEDFTVDEPVQEEVAPVVDDTEFDFDDDVTTTATAEPEPEIVIEDEDVSFDLDNDDSFFEDDIEGID